MNGKLYIVPTPIGNLRDMTFRSIDVLKEVNLILAEDTRQSKKLLTYYDIEKTMISYHKFNEHKILKKILSLLRSGENIALISDAGTPGISDPGFLLVREAVANNIPVITLPGATAIIPALVNSGLPSDKFVFEGFLPHKKGRKKRLEELAKEERTIILFVSPHNLTKTLSELAEIFGPQRLISVSREISKLYEETVRGTIKEIKDHFARTAPKGEFTVVIQGYKEFSKKIKNKNNI